MFFKKTISLLVTALTTLHIHAAAPQEKISQLQRAGNYAELADYLKTIPSGTLSPEECTDLKSYLEIKQKNAHQLYNEHMKEAQKAQKIYNDTRNALDALAEKDQRIRTVVDKSTE